jgi:hypothetical protein
MEPFLDTRDDSYISKVKSEILAHDNSFGIEQIVNLHSLKFGYFDQSDYKNLSCLIKAGQIRQIQHWPLITSGREYLDVLAFKDQSNKTYLVSIYDSDDLWQDPQVIELHKLP